ncbi:MAG: hypothetical protein ACJ786_04120, partial [Catenulispora sp.]
MLLLVAAALAAGAGAQAASARVVWLCKARSAPQPVHAGAFDDGLFTDPEAAARHPPQGGSQPEDRLL